MDILREHVTTNMQSNCRGNCTAVPSARVHSPFRVDGGVGWPKKGKERGEGAEGGEGHRRWRQKKGRGGAGLVKHHCRNSVQFTFK
jgi:hypothetical protein